MRIAKKLKQDQEIVLRFLDVFGRGSAELGSSNKHVQPGFFVFGSTFIHDYVEAVFFRKEGLLIAALEDSGFPSNMGAVGGMKSEQTKCREAADLLFKAAKAWQGGDSSARTEVSWAASEFNSTLRQHLDRLKNLILPLLEQNISPEDEHKILEGLNNITFENNMQDEEGKYIKILENLEEELSDWK
jgi:hemerythrin-like domain-containing protein